MGEYTNSAIAAEVKALRDLWVIAKLNLTKIRTFVNISLSVR